MTLFICDYFKIHTNNDFTLSLTRDCMINIVSTISILSDLLALMWSYLMDPWKQLNFKIMHRSKIHAILLYNLHKIWIYTSNIRPISMNWETQKRYHNFRLDIWLFSHFIITVSKIHRLDLSNSLIFLSYSAIFHTQILGILLYLLFQVCAIFHSLNTFYDNYAHSTEGQYQTHWFIYCIYHIWPFS